MFRSDAPRLADALLDAINDERVRCGVQTAAELDDEAYAYIRDAAENFLAAMNAES
jgi:hypothetical protein